MECPAEPSKEDCCGSGCNPCVFDVYQRQLRHYENYGSGQLQQPLFTLPNLISETKYTSFRIVSVKQICDNHSVIAFTYCGSTENRKLSWKPGQHFLMKFTGADSVKSKAYTPLFLQDLIEDTNEYDFLVIVKKYEDGLVSSYLHSKQIGDEILWRGPYGSYDHSPNKFKRICMVSQGTGIAPFYSIINAILQNEDDYTNIILFSCYKSINTILLRKQLYLLRQYWNFNYKLFLKDNPNGTCSIMYREPIEYRKMNIDDIKHVMWPISNDDGFLVCGSHDFIIYYVDKLHKEGGAVDQIIQF